LFINTNTTVSGWYWACGASHTSVCRCVPELSSCALNTSVVRSVPIKLSLCAHTSSVGGVGDWLSYARFSYSSWVNVLSWG